jgi:hypothetical protein
LRDVAVGAERLQENDAAAGMILAAPPLRNRPDRGHAVSAGFLKGEDCMAMTMIG